MNLFKKQLSFHYRFCFVINHTNSTMNALQRLIKSLMVLALSSPRLRYLPTGFRLFERNFLNGTWPQELVGVHVHLVMGMFQPTTHNKEDVQHAQYTSLISSKESLKRSNNISSAFQRIMLEYQLFLCFSRIKFRKISCSYAFPG